MKDLSLIEIINQIKNGTTSQEQVWEYFQQRIEKHNPLLNAFIDIQETFTPQSPSTLLSGVPIGVKDNFCETGILTRASSHMLENFKPPYDATVITHLKNAGFTSMGKLNMDEFAMGSTTETSYYGKTLNPWGTERIPGGSSGGSAAAVAAGLVPAALGSDTGGSIRQPASMCGIVGFKPSYGRLSRYGIIPMASSLDCPGFLTKTVQDAGLLYDITNGHDEKEDTSLQGKDTLPKDIWEKKDLTGVKIGLPKEYFEEGIDEGVKEVIMQAVETCKSLGAQIVDITLPMTKYAVSTYYILMPAEVSTNLGRFDGLRFGHTSSQTHNSLDDLYMQNRGEGFGQEAQIRSILGAYVLSAGYYDSYYKKAAQVRTLIIQDFQKAFEAVDIILSPTAPSVAWKMGEKSDDPLQMYLSDVYTVPASLAGLPAISVPAGLTASTDEEKELLPVGVQFIAPQFEDTRVLQIANVFERATMHHKNTPNGWED